MGLGIRINIPPTLHRQEYLPAVRCWITDSCCERRPAIPCIRAAAWLGIDADMTWLMPPHGSCNQQQAINAFGITPSQIQIQIQIQSRSGVPDQIPGLIHGTTFRWFPCALHQRFGKGAARVRPPGSHAALAAMIPPLPSRSASRLLRPWPPGVSLQRGAEHPPERGWGENGPPLVQHGDVVDVQLPWLPLRHRIATVSLLPAARWGRRV